MRQLALAVANNHVIVEGLIDHSLDRLAMLMGTFAPIDICRDCPLLI